MIHLLIHLGYNLGFDVALSEEPREIIIEEGNLSEIGKILQGHNEGYIWARHYSFIDFKRFGLRWSPYWISIVRDPVERVIFLGTELFHVQVNLCPFSSKNSLFPISTI